jgi:hypothetical protein
MKTFKTHFRIEVELPLEMSDANIGDAMKELSKRIEQFCVDFEYWLEKSAETDEQEQFIRVRPSL